MDNRGEEDPPQDRPQPAESVDDNETEYERKRRENIARNRAMLAELGVQSLAAELAGGEEARPSGHVPAARPSTSTNAFCVAPSGTGHPAKTRKRRKAGDIKDSPARQSRRIAALAPEFQPFDDIDDLDWGTDPKPMPEGFVNTLHTQASWPATRPALSAPGPGVFDAAAFLPSRRSTFSWRASITRGQ